MEAPAAAMLAGHRAFAVAAEGQDEQPARADACG
jgi:hypothetical protein